MSNKQNGNNFEQEFAETLEKAGYWVYVMPTKQGQPADIVAAKNGKLMLVDCKDCKGNKFMLSRIESNQITTATFFESKGNREYYFAIKISDKVYLVHMRFLVKAMLTGLKSLDAMTLGNFAERVFNVSIK